MIEIGMKEKGFTALEKAVEGHKQLIIDEYHKIESMVNRAQSSSIEKSKKEKEHFQLQVNAKK